MHFVVADDGCTYDVIQEYQDYENAASTLAGLNKVGKNLMKYLRDAPDLDARTSKIRDRLIILYHPDGLTENDGGSEHNTSYTVAKGKQISMCIRDSQKQIHQNFNTLIFVFLHEMAHVGTDTQEGEDSHSPNFWENFRSILKVAIKLGLYKYVDYMKNPEAYCGIIIDKSPITFSKKG